MYIWGGCSSRGGPIRPKKDPRVSSLEGLTRGLLYWSHSRVDPCGIRRACSSQGELIRPEVGLSVPRRAIPVNRPES